jgi:hypothetical protein
MQWYTFGQMIAVIRLGQCASTIDEARTIMRTAKGIIWVNGREQGRYVEIKDYLFSDLWRIHEDEEISISLAEREQYEQHEYHMLENQYMEWWTERKQSKK